MTTITLPRATVEQALEALAPWMDSDHTVQHAAYHALRTALAKQRLTDAQQEMERSIESLKAALAQQAEPVKPVAWANIDSDRLRVDPVTGNVSIGAQQAEPVEPVATVTECEACFTPDVCQLRGTCDYYTASQMRIAAPPQQAEPVQEPVAWSGYDLDGMVEAFSRVIEAHYQRANPFQNPVDMDAQMALRILRGFIPAMKAYTDPPQRKPLTDEGMLGIIDAELEGGSLLDVARAIERAHGITGDPK